MKEIDFIIVGQGIAGSTLAYSLIQQNKKVLIIDEDKELSASKVAAGLCNPVVFKRLTKSWMIDELLPFAKTFYKNQEKLLGDTFYYDQSIYKLFNNEQEQNFWKKQSNEPHLLDWISSEIEFPFDKDHLEYPYGAAKTLQSGYLKTAKWIASFRAYLLANDSLLNEKFDFSKIELKKEGVVWGDFSAKKIIFCEGYQCVHNPYFNWLPFKLTKGELLDVEFKNFKFNNAINKSVFMLPYEKGYKLGATYEWDDIDENITEKGKANLLERAHKSIKDEIIVLKHKAGVRPTVVDRRPLIGVHPTHNQLAVFNGMGTKGVMIAPYFANKMTDFLLEDEPLLSEVNIERFKEEAYYP
jgi:glycine/D-amino acid oxidase-like deaminating enzyme